MALIFVIRVLLPKAVHFINDKRFGNCREKGCRLGRCLQHDQRVGYFKAIMLAIPFMLGCAAVALTGAGLGVSYTFTNVAYRSFNSPLDQVHMATRSAFQKMDIKIIDDSDSQGQRTIRAATAKLDISINLEKITPKTTQIKVDARRNVVLKDKATAVEIIHQVSETM